MYLPGKERIYRRAPVLLAFLCGLAAWQLISWAQPWPSYVFPSPRAVLESLVAVTTEGRMLRAMGATLGRLVVGFGLTFVLGGLLAVLIVRWPTLRRAFTPFMLGIQGLPGVAWVPLAILWFGYTETALIFVAVMGSVFSVTMAFADAILTVPTIYYHAARTFGVPLQGLILNVGVRAALPQLVSGMKQGWSFAWRSLIGAEIVFATVGLGFLLNQGREFLDVAQVFGMLFAIVLIGILFERWVFTRIEDSLRKRWGLAAV